MPTPINPESDDLDKLKDALRSILASVSSFDNLLGAFGLQDMPRAQKYGILFGVVVFTCTVAAVVTLLILGGTFKRIAEQSGSGEATVPDAVTARSGRPLLLERLLEVREWMLKTNYPPNDRQHGDKDGRTNLTKMLLNVAPNVEKIKEIHSLVNDDVDDGTGKGEAGAAAVSSSSNDADEKKSKGGGGFFGFGGGSKKKVAPTAAESSAKPMNEATKEQIRKYIPEGYEENYVRAYRKCQDKPGGATISGRPEARFEAYARAYAGCGTQTSTAYRRSYGRMYESVACKNHDTEEKYSSLFLSRPADLIGRAVRLEALEADRHLEVMYNITSGEANLEDKSYDPNEVWGFLDFGPFVSPEELRKSPVFQRQSDEAGFAILEAVTDRVIGVIILSKDDPKNLNVQLELPIVKPSADGTLEQVEACFLLLDRLFALGYRRVQLTCDTQDAAGKKLAGRLGFTQEGMIPKHMVVKEANRDSNIYGMLNSDWDKGARAFLFKKLHGAAMLKTDSANNAKEGELEEQERGLAEQEAAKQAVEEEHKKKV
mmetsp:Transcript_21316/g.61157  ORF Transcript_21316/g.61157 Transcript_21316/m.61157 type:complete len:544 (+) Transcript_21316:224-1855(+)|eukprot:CAMPEP_0181022584 /NCGR_PEP_ID=MMETSP1070-20121207/1589_1 /TAXON_ID=265543 /ORGANISM="Minutocellus polymorphus, Strain NH13" /LENGTH=543 /DNA_ID=CAMNT_0023099529 /DNA_START=44 /DNA_END=1675 /DNA_ORIENTATION=-